MTSEEPETVEPKLPAQAPGQELPKGSSADYLSQARYGLTDEDIHSRANVRHLMARSDRLDELGRQFVELFRTDGQRVFVELRQEQAANDGPNIPRGNED